MPGLINATRYPIRKSARFIRVRHTGVSGGSLFLSDLDTPENKRDNEKIPVYVPFEETVDILLTDRTLGSYQQGSIRGFLDHGLLEAWIVQNVEVDEDKGQMMPVYDVEIDDKLITVDTSSGDVVVTLPDIFSEPFPENRTPEGTQVTVKKISNDSNRVLVTPFAGQLIDGSPNAFVLDDYLESVGLQSDDQGNWWILYCKVEQEEIIFPFLSHYNTTDGTNDASVTPPSFATARIADPLGTYGVGNLDDETPHNVTRSSFSYQNAEECTQLNEGQVVVSVTYLDATETPQTETFTVLLDGTEKTESAPGFQVEIAGIINDFGRAAGFIITTIDPLNVPGLNGGGQIVSFETRHEVGGDVFSFTDVQGVFVDGGPTPPTQNAPTLNIVSVTQTFLSGVPYATNGTTLRVQNTFQNPFNQTYQAQPFVLDATAQGFGSQNFDYNAPEITTPNPSPVYNEDADLDVTLTLSGSGTCDDVVSARTRVRDPFNQSSFSTSTLNNVLVYNRNPNPSRNSEDFRGEGRRLQRDDDFTAPNDRDLGDWDSTESLATFDDTYGLQVIGCEGNCDGVLGYPSTDYTTFTPVGPDYSGLGGETYEGFNDIRWYYRFFSNSSGTITHAA